MFRINVTRFNRDSHVFSIIQNVVFPKIAALAQELGHANVRIWSAGCSSGEEVWTTKVLLTNAAEKSPAHRSAMLANASIIGTDIQEEAITQAKLGLYDQDGPYIQKNMQVCYFPHALPLPLQDHNPLTISASTSASLSPPSGDAGRLDVVRV
jgi:chemotaxis methyl-accepting protein methylase